MCLKTEKNRIKRFLYVNIIIGWWFHQTQITVYIDILLSIQIASSFFLFFSLISRRAFRSIWYAEINGLSNSGNANYRYYPAARRAKKFSAAGTGKKLSAEPRESRRSLFSPYFFRRRFRFILPIVKILRLGTIITWNRVLQRVRKKYCPIPQTKREWITRISKMFARVGGISVER